MSTELQTADDVRAAVRAGYGAIARNTGSCCGGSGCNSSSDILAANLGYSSEELAGLPDGANLGLSCGNPAALAELREGEVVLDLGSGGGFDVFIAGRKVGAGGRAIGVDMTADMITLARKNAAAYRAQSGLDNVEFRLGEIEHLPVADACVDVVISNCVINLSPDKAQVWREIARVLKPGGRMSVSDIALLQPLPDWALRKVEALIGCIAGAALLEDTLAMVEASGLQVTNLTQNPQAIDAMLDANDPVYLDVMKMAPPGARPSDYATSVNISAIKPANAVCCGG